MTTGRKIMDWKLIGYRIAEFGTALLIFVLFNLKKVKKTLDLYRQKALY